MTPLRRRMSEEMKLRNFAPRTIQVYVERIATLRQALRPVARPPRGGGRPGLLYLVNEKHASWSYYNHALCALRFLYHVNLGKKLGPGRRRNVPRGMRTGLP
jgi:integrase/recombinase XerD